MPADTWTDAEQKFARGVFERALPQELGEAMADFKSRAASTKDPEAMWAVQEHLARARHDIDSKYDYHCSRLGLVFGRLLCEKRIEEKELTGLAERRPGCILRAASL